MEMQCPVASLSQLETVSLEGFRRGGLRCSTVRQTNLDGSTRPILKPHICFTHFFVVQCYKSRLQLRYQIDGKHSVESSLSHAGVIFVSDYFYLLQNDRA